MYQYRAVLKSSGEVIAEAHTLEEIEHRVVTFRRGSKRGLPDHNNDPIEIFHLERNKLLGGGKLKLIKVV